MRGLIILLFLAGCVSAAYWVSNPGNCPQTHGDYPGQDCSPNLICGDSGGTAQCNQSAISPPGSMVASTTDQDSGGCQDGTCNGGYIIDCFATADSGDPYCDNNGAAWCDRNSSCRDSPVYRRTNCTASMWSSSVCGLCRSGRYNCYGDTNCESTATSGCENGDNNNYDEATCDDATGGGTCECDSGYGDCDAGGEGSGNGCEVQFGVTDWPTGGNNHYDDCSTCGCDTNYEDCDASGCGGGDGCEIHYNVACATNAQNLTGCTDCQCNNNYYDCDSDLSSYFGGNGCEVQDDSSCSIGVLPGTYNCYADGGGSCVDGIGGSSYSCDCEVDDQDIATTGDLVLWSGGDPMLFMSQLGSGDGIFVNFSDSKIFNVNKTGAYWDGTDLSTPGGGGGFAGFPPWLFNDTTNMYWNESHGNQTYLHLSACSDTELYVWGYGCINNESVGVDTDTQLSQEQVEDYAGGMWTGNTETGISIDYQDGDGTIDAVLSIDYIAESSILNSSEVNTEALLEALLGDVSDVFTDNDGALDDDDVTAADVGTASPSLDDADASIEWEDSPALDADGSITDGYIVEADLKVVNSPTDEHILTYESTTGDFEWHTCAEITGSADLCDGDDATGGGGGGGSPYWDDVGNYISSNVSINNGDVNVTGQLIVRRNISIIDQGARVTWGMINTTHWRLAVE